MTSKTFALTWWEKEREKCAKKFDQNLDSANAFFNTPRHSWLGIERLKGPVNLCQETHVQSQQENLLQVWWLGCKKLLL